MSIGSEDRTTQGFEDLSALADGELRGPALAEACERWRNDEASRSTWHMYHLIGDVLRSEDLAGGAARDRRFVAALRDRLAAEPVVLAPHGLPRQAATVETYEGRHSRWSWKATSAVAAGFVAVAGVVTVLRAPVSPPIAGGASQLATLAPSAASAPRESRPVETRADVPATASAEMLRDAGLDQYLAAHKRFAGSTALGLPSSFLRSATTAETAGR